MALSFIDYTAGSLISPGVNYKFVAPKSGTSAYLFTSFVTGAVLQLTVTAPTDEQWSNVNTWKVNGPIAGRIFPLDAQTYYFRVIGPPSLAYDSTLAIKDLNLKWPADTTPKAIPTDGTPITSGFYSLDALSLEVGKFHSFSIVPANSGNLVGKHNTSDQHRFVATIFGVNTQGYPVSHMASFANTEQAIFNMDTTKAILHLSAPEGSEFNYTCSIASFSSGSGGSLTPSSDATITGAWSFTNVSGLTLQDSAPVIFGAGVDAIKMHGDGLGNAVIEGGNGATLDVAVPMNIQEPVLVTDTISHLFSGVSGEAVVSKFTTDLGSYELRLRKSDGALRLTLAGGGSSIFSTDSQGRMYATISLSAAYLISSGNFSVSGSSSLTGGVTMGQTLTVAGLTTLNGGFKVPDSGMAQYGSVRTYATDDTFYFLVPAGGKIVANGAVQFKSPATLSAESGVNIETGDARYALKENTPAISQLTQAAYDALATKNATTLYKTTDTNKVYLGTLALN